MLTRLAVKNFRLLRDVTIDVEPGKPIVLIGPNGSGKSSVIQVLDLLARAATGGLKAALQAFGGAGALISASASGTAQETRIDVVMDAAGAPQHSSAPPEDVLEYSLRLDTNPVVGADVRELRGTLSTIGIYDGFLTTPLWTRDVREGRLSPFDSAVVEPCPRIDRRGLDLVNALYYLQSSHPDEWEELERSFKAEFPFVQRLEFPADPAGGRIALGWRDLRYPGVRMHGHQMSEGMTTYLCLLAAVLSPAPATAIAFDEPERNLHPSALRRVVYLLEKLSERTAVFVATHSDRFLDYLSDPAGSLRVCEPSGDGVSIQKLEREVLDAWRAKFTLSELRRRGQIDPENASSVEP